MPLVAVRQTQRERRAGTRAALVAAAADLFARHGYDAVSVDAVAQAAGRTSGALYAHFGSKEGLLLAVLDDWSDTLVSAVTAALQEAATLTERLRAVASAVIVHPGQRTRRLLLLEHELALRAARHPALAAAVRRRAARLNQRLASGLERWSSEGVLPPGAPPAGVLATTISALVLGMEMQQRLQPDAFDVDRAAAVLEAAMTAPTPPDGGWAGPVPRRG
jgi:AcrR family transcriptional regulator